MATQDKFSTPVTRHYIDIRPLVPDGPFPKGQHLPAPYIALPLIDTLPKDIQESVRRFVRPPDRLMSLASALLKYLFIHRTAKIPWSQVQVSRTPKPHARPYWDPPADWHGQGYEGIEFNVSHQAGLVVLLGCRTPHRPFTPEENDSLFASDEDEEGTFVEPDPEDDTKRVKVGVDIACTKEYRRTPDLSTQAKLDEWVDTFSEMFSARERQDMKNLAISTTVGAKDQRDQTDAGGAIMDLKARRFYTYWALKEAYIKMVGEGLLADWLRQLEFVNVLPPNPNERLTPENDSLQVIFKKKDVTNTFETMLEGFGDTFILATMIQGVDETAGKEGKGWVQLDLERDIKPCAMGTCSCLH